VEKGEFERVGGAGLAIQASTFLRTWSLQAIRPIEAVILAKNLLDFTEFFVKIGEIAFDSVIESWPIIQESGLEVKLK